MDDIYLVPHRMTEADLQRIREAEGIDSGDYGQGDYEPDEFAFWRGLARAVAVTIACALVVML